MAQVDEGPYPRGPFKGDKGYSWGALAPVAISSLSRAAGGTVTCNTTAAHKAAPGEVATIVGSVPVGGTRFDGNYYIQAAAFGSSVLTLIPIDDVVLHQAPDTATAGGNISLVQMEQPAILSAGKAFGLQQEQSLQLAPQVFNVGGVFDGAPGAFEIDVQGADTDSALTYGLLAPAVAKITAVDANNVFNAQIPARPNFVRLALIARANAVNFAAWITADLRRFFCF